MRRKTIPLFHRLAPLCLLLSFTATPDAHAQLERDLRIQTFPGSPSSVRVENRTSEPNSVVVFRVHTFDDAGRPVRIEQGTDVTGTTIVVEVSCDESGNIVRQERSFRGRPVLRREHSYDAAGRLTGVDSINPGTNQYIDRTIYEYDEAGRQFRSTKSAERRDDEVTTRRFDDAGRVVEETVMLGDRLIRNRSLSYDERGCLVEEIVTIANGKTSRTVYENDETCRPSVTRETSFANKKKTVRTSYGPAGGKISETTIREGEIVNRATWTYTMPESNKTRTEPDAAMPSP